MLYRSTRGKAIPVSPSAAIKMGIAPDGGLFVPEQQVTVPVNELTEMLPMTYSQRAIHILNKFLTDFTEEELISAVAKAYSRPKFDHPSIAPVHILTNDTFILELWHGPTCAFKDMALQILPQFLQVARNKTDEKNHIVILVATSGDTGKAALEGFKDVSNTSIMVFFPDQGVSQVQKLQMVTQEGGNVHVVAVNGNFDDAQNAVKKVFSDQETNQALALNNYVLSSANSINWGRLVPQIVYYFSGYLDLQRAGLIDPGDPVNFVVPTGNFGNILAGYYAKQMGLPVRKLICASNANNVLTEFIDTGVYNRNRPFLKTNSPSMDILISSNLERLLFMLSGETAVCSWMTRLNADGQYTVDAETKNKIKQTFWAACANDQETLATIKAVYEQHNYVLDTHTAVAMHVLNQYRQATGDQTKTVVASTASPFKFAGSVVQAIMGEQAAQGKNEIDLLDLLAETTGWPIPTGLMDLDRKPVRHDQVIDKTEIKQTVQLILKK